MASERNCEAVLVIAADTHVGMTENGSHDYNSDERKLAVTLREYISRSVTTGMLASSIVRRLNHLP